MKRITGFFSVILLVIILIVPNSAYASTSTTQSNTVNGFFGTISNLFTNITNNNSSSGYQNNTQNIQNYSNVNSKEWWDCLDFSDWWSRFCNGGNSGHRSDYECQDNNGCWGNDVGCLDSTEIWKRWYCH